MTNIEHGRIEIDEMKLYDGIPEDLDTEFRLK